MSCTWCVHNTIDLLRYQYMHAYLSLIIQLLRRALIELLSSCALSWSSWLRVEYGPPSVPSTSLTACPSVSRPSPKNTSLGTEPRNSCRWRVYNAICGQASPSTFVLIHTFIHSLICSFIHSFIHSIFHLIIHLNLNTILQRYIQWLKREINVVL